MDRIVRSFAALALAIGLTAAPVGEAAACDCAFLDLPQAIAEAEVAIVGTLVGAGGAVGAAEPRPGLLAGGEPVQYTWAVERSKDPIEAAQITIFAWPNDGANCGMSFDADDRWLVLAYLSENRLETNGCMRNLPLGAAGAEEIAIIDELVATPVGDGDTTAGGVSVPAPLLVGTAGLAVVIAVSFLAFRRPDRG